MAGSGICGACCIIQAILLLFNTGTDRWKKLKIPNQEVEVIFEQQIFRWFEKVIKSNTERLKRFADAIKCGDAKTMEDCLNTFLRESISVRDSAARKGKKESFYHGILLGMLSGINEWIIRSNAETGNGYSDNTGGASGGKNRVYF